MLSTTSWHLCAIGSNITLMRLVVVRHVQFLILVMNKASQGIAEHPNSFLRPSHRLVQEKKMGYMETLMAPLVEAAKDDVGELK